jgi:hypothetical protein
VFRGDAVHRIGDEDPRAAQPDRVCSNQEGSSGWAAEGSKRAPQADGEGQRQEARDEEVCALSPAPVAEGERADRVTQRIVAGAGSAFDQERDDEQRAGDDAADEKRFSIDHFCHLGSLRPSARRMTTSRTPARAANATPPSVDPARSALSRCRPGDPRALRPNRVGRYRPPRRSALYPSCACR